MLSDLCACTAVPPHVSARLLKQQRRYRAATRSRRYGAALEHDLVELNLEHGDVAEADRAALAASSGTDAGLLGVTDLAFSAHGYISSSTHSSKKPTFILFVNDRLVESSALRRTVDAAFAETLPRGAHPWVSTSAATQHLLRRR